MRFGILGSLEVRDGGRELDLGRPKQRAVLAMLLIDVNRLVPVDRLVDMLWGGQPPARATGALHVHVCGLRAALEPDRPARVRTGVIATRPPGYVLEVPPDRIDAVRFEALAVEGRRLLAEGRAVAGRSRLSEAIGLWRGPALAEFLFEPFAQREAARLEELRSVALEDRIEADLALGQHATLTAELEALLAERPLRERLWAMLMLALYRSDRQSEALRALGRARAILGEELGVEPGPRLRRLEEDILNHAPSLDWLPPRDGGAAGHELAAVAPVAPPDPDRAPLTTARPTALIGRDEELAAMDRVLAGARAGRGGLVLVSGEPGIGKTRLVEEFAERAARAGAFVVWGGCYEGDGAPSFWPWVQVIRGLVLGVDRGLLRRALGSRAGEIAQMAPEVKEVSPEFEPPLVLDPAAARFRLYEAVADLLAEVAGGAPLVVVLDDLHWADVPSLRLAEFVAARVDTTHVVLVGTFRDVDPAVGGPLADTLGVLARLPSLHRAGLRGLTEAECSRFIALAFGVAPSEEVAATVHARTDGNPFFMGELARLLASEGSLSGDGAPQGRVPAGVRDVIRRRVSRLPKRTTDLLAQAAVLGRDVELPLLAFSGRADEAEVARLLEPAVANGILVRDSSVPGRYRFFHALVQETVLSELALVRKAKLHTRAAAALRVIHGSDEGHAVELAHHLYEATPVVRLEEAFDAALRAADVCQRSLAYEQSERQLRRALELVGRMPEGTERAHRELLVQHRLATLLSVTVGYASEAVAEAWSRARAICLGLGDTPEVLSSLWGLARLTRSRAQFGMCLELGEQLLELSRRSPTAAFAIAGHECCGLPRLFTAEYAVAAEHLEQAVALSEELTPEPDLGSLVLLPAMSCRAYLSCVRWMTGDERGAGELGTAARRMAAESGHPLTRAVAELYAAMLGTWRGRPKDVLARTADVRQLADAGPLGTLEPVADVLAGWAEAMLGDPEGGEERIAGAISQLRVAGWRLAMTYFLGLQADAHVRAGHRDQARAAVAAALAEVEATGECFYEAELCRRAGELTTGPQAEAWLRRAVEIAGRHGTPVILARAKAALARVLGA